MSLGGGRARIVALVLAIAFVAAMAYLLVHAIGGEDLAEEIQLDGPVSVSVPDRHEELPALIVGSLAGLLGLAGFALTSRAGAEAEKERARREAADEAREREEEARARMSSRNPGASWHRPRRSAGGCARRPTRNATGSVAFAAR